MHRSGILTTLSLVVLASACRTPDSEFRTSKLRGDEPGASPPVDPLARAVCAAGEGELLPFSLWTTPKQLEPLGGFIITDPNTPSPPPIDPFGSIVRNKPSKTVNVLLDTCLKDNLLKIKRIVFATKRCFGESPFTAGKQVVIALDLIDSDATSVTKKESQTAAARIIHYAVPRASAQIAGFEAAAFGDPTSLAVKIPLGGDPAFIAAGKKIGDEMLTGVWLLKTTGSAEIDTDAAVTGSLESQMPFDACPLGSNEGTDVIVKGTVTIEAKYCSTSQIGGNSAAWTQSYFELTITDTNAILPSGAGGAQTFRDSELAAVMKYDTDNHHHFDDRVDVTLSQSAYVWGSFDNHTELKMLAPDCLAPKKCFATKYLSVAWQIVPLPRIRGH
jgi:hypothetical protein